MKWPQRLGRHLHSQIVIPLVLLLVVLGVVATFAGVWAIGLIINQWVDQSAGSMSAAVDNNIQAHGAELVRNAKLAAESDALMKSLFSEDDGAVGAQLVLLNQSLAKDNLMLLDPDGAVVSSTGHLGLAPGDTPLAPDDFDYVALALGNASFVRANGEYTISGSAQMNGPLGRVYTLVVSTQLDDEYLETLSQGTSSGLALFDSDGGHVARSVPAILAREEGEALADALDTGTPGLRAALSAARNGQSRSLPLNVGSSKYRMIAREVALGGVEDVSDKPLYLITIAGTSVTDRARATTTNLIALWSVLAVITLLGLGVYLARSISRPLSMLSASAARVAEGDFGARVEIPGQNELSELAHGFNSMTDSLQERSESVTKKVLELATLYEMSRSLGSTLDMDTLLDSVLDSALRIFDVEIGYVTMLDRDSGKLEVRAWKGTDLSRADDATVGNSMSEWVVREGRPLIFNPQAGAEQGSEEARGDSFSGALAALCVPLPSSEGTIGAITVGSRDAEQRFTTDDVRLLATIANHVTIAVGSISLFSSVQEAYLATVRALAAAVDAKDPYTRGHSDGVATYALRIGEALRFSPEQMIALEMAAYLHDIGKIGISEDILLKPGKLTDAEMSQMRHHPLIGANILKPVAFPWPIAPIVRHHHEHYDGNGYPAGLKTEEIPILARVLTVADSFEAMVADRPYRRGRSQQEAMLELRRCSGTQFDPRIVEAFISVLESSEQDMGPRTEIDDEIGSDEAQAVYIAVGDGMFSCFRRLGGPRLANNLERAVNERLREESVPLSFQAGRLMQLEEDSGDDEVTTHLARALAIMGECIETASGAGLADHFLAEALDALPERMRSHAERLGFTPPV